MHLSDTRAQPHQNRLLRIALVVLVITAGLMAVGRHYCRPYSRTEVVTLASTSVPQAAPQAPASVDEPADRVEPLFLASPPVQPALNPSEALLQPDPPGLFPPEE